MAQEMATDLTIILPTLNEAATLADVLARVARAAPGALVIVADDDSTDGTREVAAAFAKEMPIEVLHRRGAPPGLTASVVDAIGLVSTPRFVVMDADLQHPPEAIPWLREALDEADVVVGHRVDTGGMPPRRRAASRIAQTLVSRHLRQRGIGRIEDPTSGFFGARSAYARSIIAAHEPGFEPGGFKILFDLLRFAPRDVRVLEVSYPFSARMKGTSKLRIDHTRAILRQLGLWGKLASAILVLLTPRFWRFAMVGLSGGLVNEAVLFAGHETGLPLLLASLLAVETAILWNFNLNDRWTFARVKSIRGGRLLRLAKYHAQSALGLLANASILIGLVAFWNVPYLVANVGGIAAAMSLNFVLAQRWTWSDDTDAATTFRIETLK